MAKKSKTQRAKASAARSQRKIAREAAASQDSIEVTETAAEQTESKRSLFKKSSDSASAEKAPAKAQEKKADAKPKKKRFQFFYDVKAEMKRVTWPTKQDVLRWSGVVVAALLFFGVYVALLDNVIVTPLLVAISGLGLGA